MQQLFDPLEAVMSERHREGWRNAGTAGIEYEASAFIARSRLRLFGFLGKTVVEVGMQV